MEGVLPFPAPGSPEAVVDVVVSGAGPVGLFLGCLLRKAGLKVVLVDPHLGPGIGSKAAVTMPRSLEVMDAVGVGQKLSSLGREMRAARVSFDSRSWNFVARGFSEPVSSQAISPYTPVCLGQNTVEAVLDERFRELGGTFFRAARFTGYRESESGVDVDVERFVYVRPPALAPALPEHLKAVERTTLKAKYLVGCDGKQSAVRQAMGAGFTGKEYPQQFFLADAFIDNKEVERMGLDKHPAHLIVNPKKGTFCLWVHMPQNLWRMYFCSAAMDPSELSEEFLCKQWQANFPPPGPPQEITVKDLGHFTVSCRLVDTYKRGRCLLAGDAAHCHSPAGGQGMNTGLQDSANLGWKLAAVLSGRAPASLLDSYEAERRPVAEWVLSSSDGAFRGLTDQTSAVQNTLRGLALKILPRVMPSKRLPPAFLRGKMFGLSHSYSACGTCRNTGDAPPKGALVAGDRMPYVLHRLSGSGFKTTLDLISECGLDTCHVFLVSRLQPGESELHEALSAFAGPAVKSYTCVGPELPSRCSCMGWRSARLPEKQTVALPSFTALKPFGATGQDLPTLLQLGRSGKAILAVRPDGYIAVSHRGSWDSTIVVRALREVGVLLAN